jgi:hypothetical protein
MEFLHQISVKTRAKFAPVRDLRSSEEPTVGEIDPAIISLVFAVASVKSGTRQVLRARVLPCRGVEKRIQRVVVEVGSLGHRDH